MAEDHTVLNDISTKLDQLIRDEQLHIFDENEVIVLQRMIEAWRAAEGFIRVSKYIGVVIAFIVVLWTQWDRLIELIRGLRP